MSHYLVTGGAGFIGSHLCDRLLAAGHDVIVLDDFSSGSVANLDSKVTWIKGCVTDEALVNKLMHRVDGCFHLAAIVSVAECERFPERAQRINLLGSINVFNAAANHNVPVVYASSSAVYGHGQGIPLLESTEPRPISHYGNDKLQCEYAARKVSRQYRISTVGMRIFNVFGPRQDARSPYAGVIAAFSELSWQDQAIKIYGDGEQCRDFIYIFDVVEYFMRAMQVNNNKAIVANVCTGHATTIRELANLMAKLSAYRLRIQFAEKRSGDIDYSCGDPNRAKEIMNYSSQWTLSAGLRDYYSAFISSKSLTATTQGDAS